MHHFDALAELDVQAAGEEWDDFAADAVAAGTAGGDAELTAQGAQMILVNPSTPSLPWSSVSVSVAHTATTCAVHWGNDADNWHAADPVAAPIGSISVSMEEDFCGFESASNDSPSKLYWHQQPPVLLSTLLIHSIPLAHQVLN
jgi:hypothetical protein